MNDAPADETTEARVAATLRALVAGTGAQAGTVVLDRGAGHPALVVDVDQEGNVDTDPPGPLPDGAPLPLPPLRSVTPMRVDPGSGRIDSRLGELEHLATGVRALARLLPGRSVATARFATADDGPPLTIAARSGEALVIALGERQFQAPDGWPPEPAAGAGS